MINEELLKRANEGDLEAIIDVGNAYFFGRGVEEDNAAAGVWFLKAYELAPENARVLNCMGNAYKWGCGVEENETKSMQFFRKSADLGCSAGQYNYARGLRNREDEECFVWYEKAYQNGDSDAAYHLGTMYLEGELTEKNEAVGIKYLRKAIDMENTDAMVKLGYYFLETEEEKPRAQLGFQLMKQAAELGNVTAAGNLSVYYRNGMSVPADCVEALKWARKAAELGDYTQLFYCGWCYVWGEGAMLQDVEKGVRLMEEAYDGGFKEDVAVEIADCYRYGDGIARDPEKALLWYERATREGENRKYKTIRDLYVELDAEHGIEHYRAFLLEMCETGEPMAMTRLAESYLEDSEPDKALAMVWYDKAVATGDAYAEYSKACKLADDPEGDKKEAMDLLISASEKGECGAQHELGFAYYEGKHLPQDIQKAIEWLEKAEENGSSPALLSMGKLFRDKSLKEYDPYKALTCYKAAWEKAQISEAAWRAGDMLRLGEEISQDGEEAIKYYRFAADCGDCFGYSGLALCALGGIGMKEDRAAAKQYLLKAKELGYPSADIPLALCDSPEDKFASTLERAKQGDAESQYLVFWAYLKGNGVEADKNEAFQWCARAAEQHYAPAHTQMGIHEFFAGNISTAVWHLNHAAEAGQVAAMSFLAEMYDTGNDVIAVDHQKAFMLYLRAAEAGDLNAMHAVGVDYHSGEGVSQNYAKAYEWFQKAADAGHAKSMAKVGYCYILGRGVPESEEKAKEWLEKAVENGYADAKEALDKLKNGYETPQPKNPEPPKNPTPTISCPHCNAAAKNTPPPQSTPKATGYGKYSKTIASEEFRKLEGYLQDAHQILSHAEDMEYENGPLITLRDTGNGGNNGYLCFETKIFHRPGTMEYNLPASDIEKVKAGMAAHSFTPEGGANPYSTLEKQFLDDVYGAGYVFKGGLPLCYDPDDGQWDANESCYVFRRTLIEFGTAYYESRSARQKLIKAAAYYWEKNNMNRGMLFSQV